MKVIVGGAGQVGFNIARYLAEAGHDVTVIDQAAALARKIGDNLDIRVVTGNASHPSVLDQAGADDAELLVAVTMSDEVNMVACQVASSLFEVPTRIARIRAQDYLRPRWRELFSTKHLPITYVISPEREIARAVVRRLEVPGALDVVPFAEDRVRLIAVRCPEDCPILDTPLRQLTYLFPDLHIIVVGIARAGERLFVPTGDDRILAGDEVYFVVDTQQVGRAMPTFGHAERPAERAVIAGGGNVGLFCALEIERVMPDLSLKIVESDAERARVIVDRLDRTQVILGDARDEDILREVNIGAMQAVITLTNDDEVNIMTALLAKRQGCERALSLVNRNTYTVLSSNLDIDVMINPRETTVSTVLRHVRRGRIRSVQSLRDGQAEVFEADALETSGLVGRPLRDIRLPRGVLVGAIVRDHEIVTPRGGTVIRPNDRVVMVASAALVRQVERLFTVRVDFF